MLALFACAFATGASGAVIVLSPPGALTSGGSGAGVSQQVGNATVGGAPRASLWTGTAASWINLDPAGASTSVANGTSGGQQVGTATVSGVKRASLWTGTAASWLSLLT